MTKMITAKDLYDILENIIANETQKSLIRSNFPPQIADRMCTQKVHKRDFCVLDIVPFVPEFSYLCRLI